MHLSDVLLLLRYDDLLVCIYCDDLTRQYRIDICRSHSSSPCPNKKNPHLSVTIKNSQIHRQLFSSGVKTAVTNYEVFMVRNLFGRRNSNVRVLLFHPGPA